MINSISGSNSVTSATTSQDVMGKEDFLKLLVAQLSNQDPLNPQDPTEFTSQLAQYSSLEQMFNVNKSLSGMTGSMDQLGQVSALSMLGREVVSENGRISYGGDSIDVGYYLPADVQSAAINIIDKNNVVIATLQGQQTTSGEHFLTWDGRKNDGTIAPNGNYTLSVRAMLDEDNQLPSVALTRGRVTAVDFAGVTPSLTTTFGDTPVSSLVRAYEPI